MQQHTPSIVPHLTIKNAAAAIEFYKNALGFEVQQTMPAPDGRLLHARLQLGSCILLIADEFPEMSSQSRSPLSLGGSPVTLHLLVADVDSAFPKAIAAGATETMALRDMFWGARYGRFTDPFGHQWSMSTQKREVSPEELQKAGEALFAKKK